MGKVLGRMARPMRMIAILIIGAAMAFFPMMRALAQVLTEEYSEHGVHVANVVIDGLIDSPGTRALPRAQQQPDVVMNPVKIAEAFY